MEKTWKIEKTMIGTDKDKEPDVLVRYDLNGNETETILYEPVDTTDNIQSGRLRISVRETNYDLLTELPQILGPSTN